VQDDEREEDQSLTVVKELAASNQCYDVSDPHCSISLLNDNIQQTQKATKNKESKNVSGIQDELDELVATNMELINDYAKQRNHINELQSENDRLLNRSSNVKSTNSKQQKIVVEDVNEEDKLNCSRYSGSLHLTNDVQKRSLETDISFESYDIQIPTTRKPKGTLLTGSSIIRNVNTEHFQLEIEPICARGGKINDITKRLL
jgi:phenylalanyl-tRNA synthetase alpha subunit